MDTYTELLVRGDDRDVKAFLAGRIGVPQPFRIVFAHEAGFHIRQLRERIQHHGEIVHVIVNSSHSGTVRAALESAAPAYIFVVVGERNFSTAHFAFEFDTPSVDVGSRIKALLKQPPAGVVVEGDPPTERTHPTASKAELYAPEHHYEFSGRGIARGDVFAMIDFREAIDSIDFTHCDEIEVDVQA